MTHKHTHIDSHAHVPAPPTHPVPEAMMTNVRVKALTVQSDLFMLIPTAVWTIKPVGRKEK